MVEEKLYSSELKRVLGYMSAVLLDDYPTKKITVEYFLLAILENKQCDVNITLNRYVETSSIASMRDFYQQFLSQVSSTTKINPLPFNNNKLKPVGYDKNLTECLLGAEAERVKLADLEINTEHVLLSILKDYTSKYSVTKKWDVISVNYDNLFIEINVNKQDLLLKDSNKDSKAINYVDSVVESIRINGANKESKNSAIESFCVNLNRLSAQGKIDKLVGRNTEVNRIIKVLGRRQKNNVILCSLPGCGKTAIVKGLANLIEDNQAMFLNDKIILSLDVTTLVSDTSLRGQLEKRMNTLVNELKDNKDYILFIDDIHNVLGTNSSHNSDLAGLLTTALSEGDIQLIATSSFSGYKNSIENNSSLNRRFQKIIIEPTTVEETKEILQNSKTYYEKYHNVKYTNESIDACITLANKYINERHLPDSAIDILDECGSDKKVNSNVDNSETTRLIELKKDLVLNENMRDKAMKADDYALGDEYESACKMLKGKIIDLEKKHKSSSKKNIKTITETDVYKIVSDITGVPITKLTISEKQKYLEIEQKLGESVIGQSEAIKKVAQAVKRGRMGLNKKTKPATLMFLGNSGCGKTLLSKQLAKEIFGSEKDLVRFDMSEYSDKTSVNKILGASSGYVGYEQGGLLTEAIKNKKHCVLLLDEIEKAHKDIYNVFLQVFDDGHLSDSSGVKVSFKDVVIIMTSNIGAKDAAALGTSIGFGSSVDDNKKNIINKSLKSHFPVEFLNRIDEVVHFNPLTNEDLKQIITIELTNLNKRLVEIGYSIKYNNDIIDYLFEIISKDGSPGARKINRTIQNEIEDIIVDLYLENEYVVGKEFVVSVEDKKLVIK